MAGIQKKKKKKKNSDQILKQQVSNTCHVASDYKEHEATEDHTLADFKVFSEHKLTQKYARRCMTNENNMF